MSVVNNGRYSILGTYGFKTSVHRSHGAESNQCIQRILTQHDGSRVDRKQIINVETSDERNTYFLIIDAEIHAVKRLFQNLAVEIGHAHHGVGLYGGSGVLYHDHAVFVISVGDGKSIFRQSVEECFLGITVVLKCLVIVQMVACQVGKDTSSKCQTTDSLLGYSMRADFHKGISTSFVGHSSQQLIQCNRVGSCVAGWDGFILYIVADSGTQTALITHFLEHVEQKGGNRCLSVGSGNTDEFHL